MIKVAIVGGAGYTAGELIRLLLHHPEAELAAVVSSSNAGKHVYDVHQDLLGSCDITFDDRLDKSVDVLFLCQGHGKSLDYINHNVLGSETKIIDLSQDFRHKQLSKIGDRQFVYGLPEANKKAILNSSNVANPGCFATAITLALLPLARAKLIIAPVHIHAITGSTGAGQSLSGTSHFSWRNNNISIYKPFKHQHLKEISETLEVDTELNFLPVRGNFTRGIFASCYTYIGLEEKELVQLYKDYYQEAAFTHVSDLPIHLKQVINTNKCMVHIEKADGKILITSVIDNLLKGASGQAVENMNLIFGLPQTTGLELKSSYF